MSTYSSFYDLIGQLNTASSDGQNDIKKQGDTILEWLTQNLEGLKKKHCPELAQQPQEATNDDDASMEISKENKENEDDTNDPAPKHESNSRRSRQSSKRARESADEDKQEEQSRPSKSSRQSDSPSAEEEVDEELKQKVQAMKVADLRDTLAELGEKKTGRKAELVERLLRAYARQAAAEKSAEAEVEMEAQAAAAEAQYDQTGSSRKNESYDSIINLGDGNVGQHEESDRTENERVQQEETEDNKPEHEHSVHKVEELKGSAEASGYDDTGENLYHSQEMEQHPQPPSTSEDTSTNEADRKVPDRSQELTEEQPIAGSSQFVADNDTGGKREPAVEGSSVEDGKYYSTEISYEKEQHPETTDSNETNFAAPEQLKVADSEQQEPAANEPAAESTTETYDQTQSEEKSMDNSRRDDTTYTTEVSQETAQQTPAVSETIPTNKSEGETQAYSDPLTEEPPQVATNQPVAEPQSTSHKPTTARASSSRRVTPKKRPEDNYELSDNDDDSEDENAKKQKPIPDWARGKELEDALHQQFGPEGPDPDHIFEDVTDCDLESIFPVTKKRFKVRTSSGHWLPDRLTADEKKRYRVQMGFDQA
eukprot:gb/GECG01012104.1/.p1 GENE.gb/GECG01012104.1/~~gb/GECG01012104.1/.p1  ORF type:complete len:597 (+),score=150.38 gb/GECG01012104.1/:1-1791(+)